MRKFGRRQKWPYPSSLRDEFFTLHLSVMLPTNFNGTQAVVWCRYFCYFSSLIGSHFDCILVNNGFKNI